MPDDDEATPPGADSALAGTIQTGTMIFLGRLRTAGRLVQMAKNSSTGQESDELREAGRALPGPTRRDIDRELDLLDRELPGVLWEIIERRMGARDIALIDLSNDSANDFTLAPPGVDAMAYMGEVILGDAAKVELERRLERFDATPGASRYIAESLTARTSEPPSELLGRSLLPLLVSSLETFVEGLVRVGLTKYPKGLGDLPTIESDIFDKLSGKEAMNRYRINRKVSNLIKESPEVWRNRIDSWTGIDLATNQRDWQVIVEAIQRRHLVIHADSRVDSDYMRNVPKHVREAVRLGQHLTCSPGYITSLIEVLQCFSIMLAMRWTRHFTSVPALSAHRDIFSFIVGDLESHGKWERAFEICRTALFPPPKGIGQLDPDQKDTVDLMRVNYWLCAQVLDEWDPVMQLECNAWNPPDEMLAAARCVLLSDWNGAINHLQDHHEGEISPVRRKELKAMPIFERGAHSSLEIKRFLDPARHPQKSRPESGKRRRRHR